MAVIDAETATSLRAVAGDLLLGEEKAGEVAEEALRAVARAVAGHQREPIVAGIGGGSLADAIYRTATMGPAVPVEAPAPASEPLVLRRDMPFWGVAARVAPPAWAAGRAAQSIGPLAGGLGQQTWIDVFEPATQIIFRRGAVSAPFLVLAGVSATWSKSAAALGPGSVWISARLLAPAAPAGAWVGLTIASGQIDGAGGAGPGGGDVVVSPTAVLTLSLTLAPPAAAAGHGPGADARSADVRLPANVTFSISATEAHVDARGGERLDAYDSAVKLKFDGHAPTYLPSLLSVLVPARPNPTTFKFAKVRSNVMEPSGEADITAAGWALPITIADPSTLWAAAGCGSLALRLGGGVGIAWPGQASRLPADDLWVVARPGRISLVSATVQGTGALEQIELYPSPTGTGVGGLLRLGFADASTFFFESDSGGSELLGISVAVDLSLDRPLTTRAERIPIHSDSGIAVWVLSPAGKQLLVEGTGQIIPARLPLAVALENVVAGIADPRLFVLWAKLEKKHVVSGQAALLFPLRLLLPTLPDPYAANFNLPTTRFAGETRTNASVSGGLTLLAEMTWDAAGPRLSFHYTPAQTAAGSSSSTLATPAAATALASFASISRESDAQLTAELTIGAVRELGAAAGALALLDVSSAADQFGVRFGPPAPDDRAAGIAATDTLFVIDGMSLQASARRLRVITLPAVQWEPMTTPDATAADPLQSITFADSGGETQLASRGTRLVPVAPNPALDQLLTDYNAPSHVGAVALLTFPYGIRAMARLNYPAPPRGLLRAGANVDEHRPGFAAEGFTGGRQVRVEAVEGLAMLLGHDPSLAGGSVQLSNALHNGVPTGLSAIDPITDIYNDEFKPSGNQPQVPVTRLELSGYGESLFSNWRSDTDDDPSISQVRFDVVVGRTIIDVVQARSILYPYAVRVVRTIKMLRSSSGRVLRTDSGWVAVTDGEYKWPRSDLRTHPGVVRAARRVSNIRDTGQRWTSSSGTELMAVRFDCHADIAGVVAGGTADGVLARDQLGFVQINHPTALPGMSPDEFAELLSVFGPLGGALDCVIEVGAGGQKMRVAHIGAGAAPGATGPEFAMAAWGSLALPRGGQWSVLRRPTFDPAPQPVDRNRGAPLVRSGVAGSPDPNAPFRVSDPEDLLRPNSPAAEYGLLHASGSQRVLFPRPKIEVVGPRPGQITSTEVPLLADPYQLATAVGLFPPVTNTIPFPDADYGLVPGPDGNLALSLAHNDFPVTIGDRTLNDTGHARLFARYRDEGGVPSTVHIEIDSSAAVSWAFRLERVEVGVATAGMDEVMRLLGTVRGSAVEQSHIADATIHFGGAMSPVEDLVSFLSTHTLPDLPLTQSNPWSLEFGLKIPFVGAPGEPEEIDIGIGALADADLTVVWKVDLDKGDWSSKCTFEGVITGNTPFPPLVAAGHIKAEVEISTEGTNFVLTVGLGVGVNCDFGIGKVEAYIFEQVYFVVGDSDIGFGIGYEFKGTVDLKVVSVEIDVEARALYVHSTCAGGSTNWLIAQVTIGLEVTIAWVIDIDIEYQTQWQVNIDSGPCPAPNP
jgi:hypothetical protein